MQLTKITCELRYAERMKILSAYESFYRDVMGKAPEEAAAWIAPGLRLEDKERKRVVLADQGRAAVDIEQPPNVGYCRDSIVKVFESLNRELPIPPLARWGIRFTWIQAYSGTFQDLLRLFKERFLAAKEPLTRAADIGLVLDYFDDDLKLTLTAGPMEAEQLRSHFLAFEAKGLPPVLVYADVDAADTKTRQYSAAHLGKLFSRAHGIAETMAKDVISLLRV